MKHKHHNPNKFSEKIRNVPAFVKAYFGGEHGKQQLTRSIRFKEVTVQDSKGRMVTHREPLGFNTMAFALHAAFCES